MLQSARVVIVGAGPAGLMAAISAARAGAVVTVLEKLPEAGVRLLATGGGHCNFTNTLETGELIRRYGGKNRFVAPALRGLTGIGLRHFMDDIRVVSTAVDGFHVFPVSNSAVMVRAALVRLCRDAGAELMFGSNVTDLRIDSGRISGVTVSGRMEAATAVVLSAGGASYPKLGGGDGGFSLARKAGHQIVPVCPALVPLVTRESWPSKLAGIVIPNTTIRLASEPSRGTGLAVGSLLFTHRGISGPAVLDISGEAGAVLMRERSVELIVDLTPSRSVESWKADFESWRKKHGTRSVLSLMKTVFPVAVANELLDLTGVPPERQMARISREQVHAVVKSAKTLQLTITGTEGFDKAMVTRGGVSLDDVNPKTLESRIVHGLCFAGEVLDVDGPCGGYNLQWAFSSGFLAGRSAAKHAVC